MRKAVKVAARSIFCLFVLSHLPSCQDYSFEQVQPSILNQVHSTQNINLSENVDILFMVDNSGSMVGEQVQLGRSFKAFTKVLDQKFGVGKYQIGVITAGMASDQCPNCTSDDESSCINATLENGRFQDRLGKLINNNFNTPKFDFIDDATCRVVKSSNLNCFYCDPTLDAVACSDNNAERGIVMVGTTGCGYERGLASIRSALGANLLGSYNSGFLRSDATLAVVVISDEEDCGEVGDVNEGVAPYNADLCYFASKGVDGTNETTDPNGKTYKLTPVEDYFNFLKGLKPAGMVKFAAIVGVKDNNVNDLSKTIIEIDTAVPSKPRGAPKTACTTAGCTGSYCSAYPGTRYIQLAQMFGSENGFVDTICQPDFSKTMEQLGNFVACPRFFKLSEPIRDPGLANILVNRTEVPRYTCQNKTPATECKKGIKCSCVCGQDVKQVCDTSGAQPDNESCSGDYCVETWTFCSPDTCTLQGSPGGAIVFAPKYDPCNLIEKGQISIDLVYVPD